MIVAPEFLVDLVIGLHYLFAGLGIVGVLNHDIWLDEAHHWLFARDSLTPTELIANMRYDGHPILWNLMLFGITRLSQNVVFMQLLHVCISVTAVAVFLFFSPFKFSEKILFVFGYFVLYEYTVISRNYGLLMLLLFLVVVLYEKKKYIWLGLTLAMLANTHLFGLAIACFFFVMACYESLFAGKVKPNAAIVTGTLLFLAGVTISLWQIIPPSDTTFFDLHPQAPSLERMGRTSSVFLKGFIPVPDFTNHHFWNTNLLMTVSKPLCTAFSCVLFFVPLLSF